MILLGWVVGIYSIHTNGTMNVKREPGLNPLGELPNIDFYGRKLGCGTIPM